MELVDGVFAVWFCHVEYMCIPFVSKAQLFIHSSLRLDLMHKRGLKQVSNYYFVEEIFPSYGRNFLDEKYTILIPEV